MVTETPASAKESKKDEPLRHGRHGIRTQQCQVCRLEKPLFELVPASFVRKAVVDTIRKENPNWSPDGFICTADLNHYRTEHIQEILTAERGELSVLETEVAQSIARENLLATSFDHHENPSFGARIADRVAEFGGSWRFIISFSVFIVIWIIINSIILLNRSFDPYPFILLNLMLSCLAALQAPVIMMSQNRQEAKDRKRAEYDFKVNLKAELEIRHMNEKIDHLINRQWQSLLETQQIMIDMLEEYAQRTGQVQGEPARPVRPASPAREPAPAKEDAPPNNAAPGVAEAPPQPAPPPEG